MRRIIFCTLCVTLLSCKKDKAPEFRFESCDLGGKNIQVLKSQSGTLSYTNTLGSYQLPKFSYYIIVSGQLPLEVCNMPPAVKLTENEVQDVVFDGEMVVLSPNTDAISSTVQLSNLSFE
jgi:hypothetical protein